MNLSKVNAIVAEVQAGLTALENSDYESNQFVTVVADKPSYVDGERSTLSIRGKNLPTNPELELIVEATFNGGLQKVEVVENGWRAVTPRLASGSNNVTVRTFAFRCSFR